jgi:MFS family permease
VAQDLLLLLLLPDEAASLPWAHWQLSALLLPLPPLLLLLLLPDPSACPGEVLRQQQELAYGALVEAVAASSAAVGAGVSPAATLCLHDHQQLQHHQWHCWQMHCLLLALLLPVLPVLLCQLLLLLLPGPLWLSPRCCCCRPPAPAPPAPPRTQR